MRYTLISCVFALSSFTSGCISISSFQTARTQKRDEASGFFGIGYESLVIPKKSSDSGTADIQEEIEEIKIPVIEGGMRYGLTNSLDVGVRLTLPGSIAAETKYQFTDPNQDMAMAIGFGLGTGGYSTDTSNYDILDLFVPFWVSMDFNPAFSVYLSPRVLNRSTTFEYEDIDIDSNGQQTKTKMTDKDSATFIGATAGISLYGFVLEAGYFSVPGGQTTAGIAQVMVGYWGGWDETSRPEQITDADEDASPSESQKKRRSKRKRRVN